jgi:hypothetical protein
MKGRKEGRKEGKSYARRKEGRIPRKEART